VADLPEAKNSILVNIRSSAEALRQEQCRQNVFHIIPDSAMRADAIAQYLIWKKWPEGSSSGVISQKTKILSQGLRELNIQPKTVEEVVPTYIGPRAPGPH
jgi:ABC-type branched-subunit amino acid transport system substrate-binding protein